MSRESEMTAFITARLDEATDKAMKGQDFQRLKTIAALRSLLRAHVGYYGAGDDEHFPIPTLSILAAIWDDHEDYADAVKAWGDGDA